MKQDLAALMRARQLDALLVTGSASHNPAMVYFTGIRHISDAILIKKPDTPPVLFARSMERDEAAKSGYQVQNLDAYRLDLLLEQQGGDASRAYGVLFAQVLSDAGVTTGRVGLYGQKDAGQAYAIFSALQQAAPHLELVGELDQSVLLQAMATKDAAEVDHIRQMGRITTEVVARVADLLTSSPVRNEVLYKMDGSPLTIGDVKRNINLWLVESGAENPDGTIFAIGRDAAVPHSTGTASDPIRLGRTIVFDIFPCQAGGGYYYDFTRTWCLGYAPDEALALYEDVLEVFQQIKSSLRPGTLCSTYQQLACDLFDTRGHPTLVSRPLTETGYVHGLGHGVGLHIHERPSFRVESSNQDRLQAGMVTTIEPGLYYPDRGLGMRLEDTLWIRPDGEAEVLAEYPLDLVLPVRR